MDNLTKAKQLLAKMTLEEKIGQLALKGLDGLDEQGVPRSVDLLNQVRNGAIGTIIQLPNDYSVAVETLQKIAVNESRLGIPLLVNTDLIHGLDTVFPIPLAASCSFDCELVELSAKAAAAESAACGIHYTNAPMIDVCRDARWGRICECQGEDPFLAGEMAKAYVRGFQNEDNYIMSTLKHYAAYGSCEGGRDYDTSEVCENTMLNCYLIPFREGVKAGAASVMSSFNSIENIPASGNKKYLRHILRDKFGFNGIVISDAMSVPEMLAHGYCETYADCAYRAIKAGLDIELGTDCFHDHLVSLVESGRLDESEIDEAVIRVLKQKFDLGLFDDPFSYQKKDKQIIYCQEHRELAKKLALECPVLLENNGILPLKKGMKVAVVGVFSNNKDLCGCWQFSSKQDDTVTLVEGLKNSGFEITGTSDDYNLTRLEIASYNADVVILNWGETQDENGEAHSKHNLDVPKEVKKCYDYLKGRGKKVVTLLFAGRPLIVNAFKCSDALAFCWNLGQSTGDVVAKLLSGEENFSGKLTVTVPRTTGQLPIYYNRKNAGRPFLPDRQDYRFQVRYDDGESYPQYNFGYGISYSKFIYSDLKIDKAVATDNSPITLSFVITNESDVDGVEIAQLYIKDHFAEVVRPSRELKGFKRVALKARERRKVEFYIDTSLLSYYHEDGELYADIGTFTAFVGGDSTTQYAVDFQYDIEK